MPLCFPSAAVAATSETYTVVAEVAYLYVMTELTLSQKKNVNDRTADDGAGGEAGVRSPVGRDGT